MRRTSASGFLRLIGFALGVASCASAAEAPKPLTAGQGKDGPWWMRQTVLTKEGKLSLKDKPWWPRAAKLKVGEQFIVEAQGGLKDRMLVRREKFRNRSARVEAIVWIIDDDGDGSVAMGGDGDSDCYVVDYGCDGTPDRMLDWIDDDGDNDPDEMDVRYFVGGELRQVWASIDYDDDNLMWNLAGYEYAGNFFNADAYGDAMIFMNKLNPERGEWWPVSECPFAFYDTDADGYSEVVVRVSAVPLGYSLGSDADYANDARRYRGPWTPDMRTMGNVNVRYSFDVDNLSGKEMPLHYEMGFNLVGAQPYQYPGMEHFNAKRRPPQVLRVAPFKDLRKICDAYPANETGFSWYEQEDDTTTIGHKWDSRKDRRWEGVFWIWERRFMGNTGGPCQRWNMRREWCGKKADTRELYYSGVDRRIHLFGASEGWLQIGHFAGQKALGEIRMFDTDGNGFFDRWEVYWGDSPVPIRVSHVRDEKAKRIPFDYAGLVKFHNEVMAPQAIAANKKLMTAMAKLRKFDVPVGLKAAMETGSPNEQRYVQDVVREMQYQDLRQDFAAKADAVIAKAKQDDLRRLDPAKIPETWNTGSAWQLILALKDLDVAYGQGDFDAACAALGKIGKIEASVKP